MTNDNDEKIFKRLTSYPKNTGEWKNAILTTKCPTLEFIQFAAGRDDEMTDMLRILHEEGDIWPTPDKLDIEIIINIVLILGLISTRKAGLLLLEIMIFTHEYEKESKDIPLILSLSHFWPAFFRNKPDSVHRKLLSMATDKQVDLFLRSEIIDVLLRRASYFGENNGDFEKILDVVYSISSDEDEEEELRLLAASSMLDYPRQQYRQYLEDLAKTNQRQFDTGYVADAYAGNKHFPYRDPWEELFQ